MCEDFDVHLDDYASWLWDQDKVKISESLDAFIEEVNSVVHSEWGAALHVLPSPDEDDDILNYLLAASSLRNIDYSEFYWEVYGRQNLGTQLS